jgi:uncharacterized phage protein (TIGR02218 family)
MKQANSAVIALLNSGQEFIVADLYTFSILTPSWDATNGLTFSYVDYHYTSTDQSLTYNGKTYSATGVLIERDRIRLMIGVEVDTLNLKVFADSSMLIAGYPFLQSCQMGMLDGALVRLDKAFVGNTGIAGTVNMFSGRVSTVKPSRSVADIEIKSDLELLNIQMPRNLYQSGCQHTLYDSACGLKQNSFSHAGAIVSATRSQITPSGLTQPSGYYDLGSLIFTSGALQNTMRTIKSWDGSAINLIYPLPFTPAVGDVFQIYPGCDKQISTCQNKFSNFQNFRGFPFIPVPETMR